MAAGRVIGVVAPSEILVVAAEIFQVVAVLLVDTRKCFIFFPGQNLRSIHACPPDTDTHLVQMNTLTIVLDFHDKFFTTKPPNVLCELQKIGSPQIDYNALSHGDNRLSHTATTVALTLETSSAMAASITPQASPACTCSRGRLEARCRSWHSFRMLVHRPQYSAACS